MVFSALFGCGLSAPVADADAQYLGGAGLGLGYGATGLVGGGLGLGYGATGLVGGIAAPAVAAVAAPVAIATAPVVQQIGYNVHHQVHTIPQVSVQKQISTITTQQVINHPPVVGAALGAAAVVAASAIAVTTVAAPAVAVAAPTVAGGVVAV